MRQYHASGGRQTNARGFELHSLTMVHQRRKGEALLRDTSEVVG